ncbi:hypothetical protein ACQ4PT_064586 [Festuca glaucescens]
MAEVMVSTSTGVMNSLLAKLTTLMGEEFAKLKNLRKEVKFISDELGSMKDALEKLADVDELDPQTKRWRNTLREISYDIEDIIDDFLQNIGEKDHDSWFGCKAIQGLKTLIFRHRLAGKIEEIKKLVCETSGRRKRYVLDNIVALSSSDVSIDPRVVTLYQNAASLIGVEGPKNELVDWLKDEEKQLKVVSIVGFGGLGKTTLANVVYGGLKEEFNCCAFVPVSQKPNIPKLLLSLLSQLGIISVSHECGLNVLLDQLRKHLKTERYLIIIDDLWDVSTWDIIKCAFPENDLGSRVIVTTRIQEVSMACCPSRRHYILQMKPLSDEDSRKLFFGRIFGSEEACPHLLRDVSVEILKRCGGLPLAIISTSSMLANDGFNQKERFEHVRDSLGSAMNLTLERVRKILYLSYKDLPPHLRTCFLYLGMYPEDYKIDRCNLERQWMAEGFICKENGQDVEKVAKSYFNELVNRSLIQPVDFDNRGSVTTCKVHDMMVDLILIKSGEEKFFTIVDDPQAITGLDYKIRRLSIRMESYGGPVFPSNISMSQVRTIMLFGHSLNTPSLSECKFLRVFFSDLLSTNITIFTGLCKLYHLRYLHISGTIPGAPPIEISVPQHLETLHLHSRRLHRPDSQILLPDGIGDIKSLRDLTGFDFSVSTLNNIKGLGELANLRKLVLICSSIPDGMERRMDTLCSSLGRLSSLEDLVIMGMQGWVDGLLPLSPPPTPYRLQTLLMTPDCWFSRVPSWMGELHNLWELRCQVDELLNDDVVILAQLPALTHLHIRILNHTSEMIMLSRNTFPELRRFKLHSRGASYLTFQPGAMPKLQKLKLRSWASVWEQNEIAPAGIEHLLALEEFSTYMYGVKASDKTNVESTLRSAVNLHPGSPCLVFST